MHRKTSILSLGVAVAGLFLGGASHAACSRPIVVPSAPTGYSIIVKDGNVSGVYPELLHELGRKFGCRFEFPVVPRARLEKMFFNDGTADLLIPATRTPERDQQAQFFSLIGVTPGMMSLQGRATNINSVEELAKAKTLRGAMVRSFNYGAEYQGLLRTLDEEKRVDIVPDLVNVTAMVARGRVDFTIMAPTLFYSTAAEDPDFAGMLGRIQYRPLAGIDKVESGVYLSRKSLTDNDLQELRKIFDESVRGGLLWKKFQAYYPAEILRGVVPLRP